MAERVSKVVIKTTDDSGGTSRTSVSMRGYVSTPTSREVLDSIMTSVTGLEGPKLTVTGGDVAYGGSVFTGITPNNRELVFTLRPMGMDLNTLKIRINTLIGLSGRGQLELEIFTVNEQGGESRLFTTGYISDVAAPLFDNKQELTLTFISPFPYLNRDRRVVTSDYVLMPTPDSTSTSTSTSKHWSVYGIPSYDRDDSAITAPSPFNLVMRVAKRLAPEIGNITVEDSAGNQYITSHYNSFPGLINLTGDALLGNDTYAKLSTAGDSSNEIMYIYRNELRPTVIPEWPMVYPYSTNLGVGIKFRTPQTIGPGEVGIWRYTIYPRVYGI